MRLSVWPIVLLISLGALAVIAGRAAVRRRGVWPPAAAIWVSLAVAQYVAIRPHPTAQAVVHAVALWLPVAVAALVARAEVRRGHTLWRAGSVAFMLSASVGAVLPLLVGYVVVVLACATTGNCL